MELAPIIGGRRRVFCCHRATLSGRRLPNSLAAVRECVEAGAPRLEIDVRFLRDDAMLVFHDRDLAPDTDGYGAPEALDRPAIERLRYRAGEDERLAFLEEIVDALRGSTTLLQVDLKPFEPISPGRVDTLAAALAPIRDQVLIGSQAHWNLRPLHDAGFRIALDSTLQWHYAPGRSASFDPAREGLHGLWDDSPVAHLAAFGPERYVRTRIADLLGLVPAVEWMVDVRTIHQLARLGVALGEALMERGVELAVWTLKDRGRDKTRPLLDELFGLGVTTIITDAPAQLASYVSGGG